MRHVSLYIIAVIDILQIGPGVVYLMFESFFGKGVFIHNMLPVEPLVQKLVHNIYIHWTVPNIIAKFFMLGEAIHVSKYVNLDTVNNMMNVKSAIMILFIHVSLNKENHVTFTGGCM